MSLKMRAILNKLSMIKVHSSGEHSLILCQHHQFAQALKEKIKAKKFIDKNYKEALKQLIDLKESKRI